MLKPAWILGLDHLCSYRVDIRSVPIKSPETRMDTG
nr:MAG TPA: hypothetical protein [Caudoviricetes sp.]